jgi:hypothetical protein
MENIIRDRVLDFAKCNKILNDFKEWVDDCKQRRFPKITLKWIKIGQARLKTKMLACVKI